MIRTGLFLLALAACCLGCGDDLPAQAGTCEVADVHGAVRCFNEHGICYFQLDGNPLCLCNGDDPHEENLLCAEAMGFYDGGRP